MNLFRPKLPDTDPLLDATLPFEARVRRAAVDWALDGFGAPLGVYVIYGLKLCAYLGGFWFFCTNSLPAGASLELGSWAFTPRAFQKAIVWSALFEVLGLGCGSGPLTGRYLPPIGGLLYFLRPGTAKRPLFAGLPFFGHDRRTWSDVLLYVAFVVGLVRVLALPNPTRFDHGSLLVLWALISITDKTIGLAARSEHYATTVACFAMTDDWLAGAMCVQLALWFWAAAAKLNRHFPGVIGVMMSNNPLAPRALRRRMYRRFPDDLRPSRLAETMAHAGTALEFAVPCAFVYAHSPPTFAVAAGLMILLHAFITSSVPLGVPIEWNAMVMYGGFALFVAHPSVRPWEVPLPLGLLLLVPLVALPWLGNRYPDRVSFLPSMRYYAGNWAYSVWLFRGESFRKLHKNMTLPAPWVGDQIERLFDLRTAAALLAKLLAFRAMHLHGRALGILIPRATQSFEAMTYLDGEVIAGLTLGWNFGDGHLHDEALLGTIQRACAFEPGELRCIFVESQPLFERTLAYRIVDAASGPIESGKLAVAELQLRQPWAVEDASGSDRTRSIP